MIRKKIFTAAAIAFCTAGIMCGALAADETDSTTTVSDPSETTTVTEPSETTTAAEPSGTTTVTEPDATDPSDLVPATVVTDPTDSGSDPTGQTAVWINYQKAVVVCKKKLPLLRATTAPEGMNVTWSSSDPSVATVTQSGIVSGLKAGYAVITVTTDDGKSDTCTVTVLYKDVTNKDDFWYEPTYELTDKGIVKGYNNQTSFKPENNCTRAQMVTFIWRLAGCPAPGSDESKFSDVVQGKYYFKPVLWACEQGITTGYKDGTFKPNVTCLRRHAVTFLWRYAGCPAPSGETTKFTDVKEDAYYFNPVIWATEKKILEGYKDGTFKPEGECLRRQMVTFLYKYDKFVVGADEVSD